MDHEREDDDEIDLTTIQRTSSMDSLEPNESNVQNLQSVHGSHKWLNNYKITVEKSFISHDDDDSLDQTTLAITNKIENSTHDNEITMDSLDNDLSLHQFDVQLQVNGGQLTHAIRYGVFSSSSSSIKGVDILKLNQYSQTIEPEMDMDSRGGNSNGQSRQYHTNANNGDNSYRRNRDTNGSSGNSGRGNLDENASNSNGNNNNNNNNNNNRKGPNDDDSADNDDDDDDDNETDESVARRLGFRPIDSETIRTVNRLRHLTNKKSFDRRDFENLQYLIDELIRLQRLENSSEEQLQRIVHRLRLYRILQTKANALQFIQDRLPRRLYRTNNDSSNVFDIWRQRERRARLDSKDSLEEEGQSSTGQTTHDKIETNNESISPVFHASNNSKVKQMAKNIDTRSESSKIGGEQTQTSSTILTQNSNPISNRSYNDVFAPDRSRTKRPVSPISTAEQYRVRSMIDRLESSSSSAAATAAVPSSIKVTHKISTKKSFSDDHPADTNNFTSTVSPRTKDTERKEHHEYDVTNRDADAFVFRNKSPHEAIYVRDSSTNRARYEHDRGETSNTERYTTTETTVNDYGPSLIPGTETSISMVRDVRARFYDDDSSVFYTNAETIPVKVDVETLYIVEEKAEKRFLPSDTGTRIPEHGSKHISSFERHDFGSQTAIPIPVIKPPNRPIGTQVDSVVEQSTVAAQTTDSLHWPPRERQTLQISTIDDDAEVSEVIRTTETTTTKYEMKRRHSSHHTSEDGDDGGTTTIIYTDSKDGIQTQIHTSADDHKLNIIEPRPTYEQITDRKRNVVRRRTEQSFNDDETRSDEVYEIHTRGACKCLVVSYEEKIQYGSETRFEKQLQRIERTYTEEEVRSVELHVIVTASDANYQLVRRDYGPNRYREDDDVTNKGRHPSISIHYYTKEGHRMSTEHGRRLENLPLFIRCEIEYELNHYGSAHIILLSVTNAERRQMVSSVKRETVDEFISRLNGRFVPNCPKFQEEIARRLAESISLFHLVDYSSRDDRNQMHSHDIRRVSRVDVTTSLRIVQRYRTLIHRLCQLHRSHLRLSPQAELQRHLILVSRDDYYLLDLASQTVVTSKAKCETFQRDVRHVPQQPFDYAKYRRDIEQQQRILEEHYRKTHSVPQSGPTSEAEFYLGAGRRALIEREIHTMRESIRPHEHAPPRYKNEPIRRSLSICYTGGQRYVRARIIHVRDFYETNQQEQQVQVQDQPVKEQELFVRVDDYVNETAASILRRSYSTDYLQEDGPRSRIRYMRIPGETIRVEEKTTHEYQGIMYADLPYSLKYWNILYILDREAREGRPLGSSLPHVIVNDPYRTVIPPLTQQEIRQTARDVLSPQYPTRSYTDQTLRWFLSRDNRTEVESTKYLATLNNYRQQQQQQRQQQGSTVTVQDGGKIGLVNKYYVTETLVHYEKMPDRLVPVTVSDRARSTDNILHHSSSTTQANRQAFRSQTPLSRPSSQLGQPYQQSQSTFTPAFRTQLPTMHKPLSRHQSVHELHAASTLSHPPSPSPSLHSLHAHQQTNVQRRPVAYNNRYQVVRPPQQQTNTLLTEIIDSQTGQRILTTSQEQLPNEVLGLLNRYNLQHF